MLGVTITTTINLYSAKTTGKLMYFIQMITH